MKKIIILFVFVILLTGCGKKEKLVCDLGTTTITITFKSGKIISYYDKITGEISKDNLKELNETYLKNINNNTSAIEKLKEVINEMDGVCQ